ncbi:receptor-like kinase [Trifolium medium]|uniref:RING-type E3 ubiquitin transferase n=1 Tax=Trifolium medium TaxID=97028 RepID=A0A392PF37_9FABA|nr:receptor-like kinase [Trifolium medium]
MVTSSNIVVVTILIMVCNFNTAMWKVNGCNGRDIRCGRHGPLIRFPFRLKDRETEHGCSYNGFEFTCSDTHKTLLELPSDSGPIILEVIDILYEIQRLSLPCPVYVVDSLHTFLDSGLDPILCTKTLDIISSAVATPEQHVEFERSFLALTWSKPNCSKCENEGKMCKLKNNGTGDEIDLVITCFLRIQLLKLIP